MVGVIDVASARIELPEEVAEPICNALDYVPADHIIPCTNRGMVPLSREIARGKLHVLVDGAALVRKELEGT